MEAGLVAMLTQKIVVAARTGHTNYGAPTFSASASTFKARVVDRPGFVRNNEGEDVAYRSIAWVASTGTLDVHSRYTLPDGTSPPVVQLERYPDEKGTHHHKVFFGY